VKARRTRVCRFCLQPLPDWSSVWPHEPGVYLFYGYPVNAGVDRFPRLILVTVEGYNDEFGTIYRTARSTLKKTTGAAGMFMPLLVPKVFPDDVDLTAAAEEASEAVKKLRIKPLVKRLSRRMK